MKKSTILIHFLEKDLFELLIFIKLFDKLKLFFQIKKFVEFFIALFVRNYQLDLLDFFPIRSSYFSMFFADLSSFNPQWSSNFLQSSLQEMQPIWNGEFARNSLALFISCHFILARSVLGWKAFRLFPDQFFIHRRNLTFQLANSLHPFELKCFFSFFDFQKYPYFLD